MGLGFENKFVRFKFGSSINRFKFRTERFSRQNFRGNVGFGFSRLGGNQFLRCMFVKDRSE